MNKLVNMKAVAKAAGRSKPVKKAEGPKTNPKPAPMAMAASDRKWRAEDAMRDIMRAEEHRKDPKLMADVNRLAKQKAAALDSLCRKGK